MARMTPWVVLAPAASAFAMAPDSRPLPLQSRRITKEPHQAKPPGLSGAPGRLGKVKAPAADDAGRSSFSGFFGSPIAKPAVRFRPPRPGR
jgi:hypothetical protein